jgi:BON domain
MKARIPLSFLAAVLLLASAGIGCNKAAVPAAKSDAEITSEIQNKFAQDSGLQDKQLTVQSANGAVTIAGNVDTQAQRDAAAKQAASTDGVKQVINNLQVAAPAPVEQQAAAPPPPVEEPRHVSKPRASARKQHSAPSSDSMASSAPPAQASAPVASAPATPPPPPPPQKVTIPSGTSLAVRLVDGIDTEKNQTGQTFRATLDSPLSVDGEVAVPAGYDVEGHIVDLKSAGKFAGQSVVVLQLDRISVGGKSYNIQTDQYKKQGSSRGKNTAEKVGGGAGLGAIIGAIAGGGKGAAIGAAAGGGLGGGVQAATKSQQIKLPTETVLNFTLQGPVTVVATSKGPNADRPKLDQNQ